ncbi:hypothetical protein FKM82_009443 [Ascaphus truei]
MFYFSVKNNCFIYGGYWSFANQVEQFKYREYETKARESHTCIHPQQFNFSLSCSVLSKISRGFLKTLNVKPLHIGDQEYICCIVLLASCSNRVNK